MNGGGERRHPPARTSGKVLGTIPLQLQHHENSDSILRMKLARHRYNQPSDLRDAQREDDKITHAALLAAIGTPEGSDKGSDADPFEDADVSTSSSATTSHSSNSSGEEEEEDDEDEASTASSSEAEIDAPSSEADEDPFASSGNSASLTVHPKKDPPPIDLDAVLGKPASGSLLTTMAEQTKIDSPLRYLDDILDGTRDEGPSTKTGLPPLDPSASPGSVLNRLLSANTPLSRNSGGSTSSSVSGVANGRRSGVQSASDDRSGRAAPRSSGTTRSSLHMLSKLSEEASTFGQTTSSAHSAEKSAGVGPMLAIDGINFRKGREVGKGGFGVVFQAILEDGRMAAVKQLPATDQKGIEKEMRVMCSLPPHPHCVQYLGVKRTSRHVYMVMEYVSGGSIMSLRKMVGPLPESLARRYIHMTLLGLVHLHANQLIHQDIKGGNVLLDERGVAKIADFGCIKVLSSHTTQSGGGGTTAESTQGGAGTPLWMSPEVCRGEYPSKRSDIWSLGCLFLEMTNGSGLPWNFRPGTTLQGAAYAIGSATRSPPFPEHLSSDARSFLERCLAIKPSDRWSAEQLLQHPFFVSNLTAQHLDPTKSDLTFFNTVMSVSSSSTGFHSLMTTQTTAVVTRTAASPLRNGEGTGFVLEAASDDDDESDKRPPATLLGKAPRNGAGSATGGSPLVWKSEGALRVPLRKS